MRNGFRGIFMRLLLLSAILVANVAFAEHQGAWVAKSPAGDGYSARLLAIAKGTDFVFTYYTEGKYHCEVPGIARRAGSDAGKYVFKNIKEYWLLASSESYGVPEQNGDCVIEFTFSGDTVQIEEAGGNCKSFCGIGGSLDAVLERIVQ